MIPNPPKPPEGRLVCNCCGYSAKKSEYKHRCYAAIALTIIITAIASIPIVLLTFKLITT